jgi:NAD(P)-dependent dehydrogenase (short-subunit alcohol dehydrogenase family)
LCWLPGGTGYVGFHAIAALVEAGHPIAYAAAKAGIIVFSQQVAKDVGPSLVSCLAPFDCPLRTILV